MFCSNLIPPTGYPNTAWRLRIRMRKYHGVAFKPVRRFPLNGEVADVFVILEGVRSPALHRQRAKPSSSSSTQASPISVEKKSSGPIVTVRASHREAQVQMYCASRSNTDLTAREPSPFAFHHWLLRAAQLEQVSPLNVRMPLTMRFSKRLHQKLRN
jgi:hypothetical protein